MIGQTVSHYRIVEKLGEGGMGAVYKAEDTKLHRPVALKFLPTEMTRDESAKRQFVIEAQAASALDHPNIAVVHDISETDDGRSYICMAYYPGFTLKKKIEAGPLEHADIMRLSEQIGSALQRAHEAGIVHQDIKPANIILTEHGEAKIVDFGLAKLAGQTRSERKGPIAGTAGYMSPEQIAGTQTDQRSDLFSLGVVMYEMATGRRPFPGDHEAALFYSILNLTPPPPSIHRPGISPALERIILRLLEKEPADRYQSASDLLSDLALVDQATGVRQASTGRMRWITAGITLLLGLAAAIVTIPPVRETIFGTGSQSPALVQVAVLPFTVVGADPKDRMFCDGLMEVLTSKLSELREFQRSIAVVPAVEIRNRGITTPSEARNIFKVSLAIAGSIQRLQNQVRLTVSLIDAKELRQKSSLVIDSDLTNVASFQDGIVLRLAHFLDVQLDPRTVRQLASDSAATPGAYALYLQAHGYLQHESGAFAQDSAISLFQHAIAEDPSYVEAYHGLASVYEGFQQYEKAESTYTRAIRARPGSWLAQNNLGVFLTTRGRFTEATSAFRRVIALAPDNVRGYNNLGGIDLYLGQVTEARRMFDRSLELLPNPVAYANLGTLLFFYEGSFKEAAAMYEKALQFDDRDYEVWGSLAAAYYYEPSLRHKARAAYVRAAALAGDAQTREPRNARVLSHLADFTVMLGEESKARALMQEALQLSPTDPDILERAAEIHEFLGERSDALQLVREALRHGYGADLLQRIPALKELRKDVRFEEILRNFRNSPH